MTPVGEHLIASAGAETVARALLGVVDALDYAQGKGYLHRDVSVGNVVWDAVDERGCLLDWHIAVERSAVTEPVSHGLTVTGTRLFTAVALSRRGHVRCVEVCHFSSCHHGGRKSSPRRDKVGAGSHVHWILVQCPPFWQTLFVSSEHGV